MPRLSALRRTPLAGRVVASVVALIALIAVACGPRSKAEPQDEKVTIARTEFTERIENFFEYEPLKVGKASQFLIHLTDLSDGSPVEQADVLLSITEKSGGASVGQVKARVGKVAGIYVADVTVPKAAQYDVEFRIRNAKLDERMALADFKAE